MRLMFDHLTDFEAPLVGSVPLTDRVESQLFDHPEWLLPPTVIEMSQQSPPLRQELAVRP
jgi:hypothetical protein